MSFGPRQAEQRADRKRGRVPFFILAALGLALCGAAQAQIAFRGFSSGSGPAGGTITFRAASNAVSGAISFRAAASSGTPTTLAPVFRGVASGSSATGVLTLTVARPAATLENDVMVASIAVSASAPAITAPAGWTLVRRLDNPGPTANSLAIYYKIAGATEPANYTWTFSASSGAVGGIQSFGNVDIVNPIDAEAGQTTPVGTSHTAPSITTTVPNAMLVSSHTFASSRLWTPPAGMTESFDVRSIPSNNPAGQSLEGNRQRQATAGPTGAKTATAAGNADAGNAHLLALRPALRIPVPAGTSPSDVMIAAIGVQPSTAALTPPAGWTLVRRVDNAAGNANSLAVYRKVAGGSEPASYLWSVTGAAFAVGAMQVFAGVDATSPIDVENGQATASGLAHTAPSVTTTVANTMVVTHHTFSSSATWTPPAGMTESFDVASPAPNNPVGQSMEGARVSQAGAGATGAKTATASANPDTGNAHILALRPSSASIMINRPAGVLENDVLVAGIGFTPSSVTVTPPSGWMLVRRTDNGGGVTNALAVYVKVATAAEPAGYYWSFSAPVTAVGGIQAFVGVDRANPIDVESGQATPSGTAHPTPNVTTTVANTMVVTHHTYSSSQNWTPPAGMTESFDRRSGGASPTGQSIEGNRVPQAAAGATGVKTATAAGGAGSADFGNTHILALRPQPGNQIVLNTPAGTQPNDVMIAGIGFHPNTLGIIAPAGWTLVRRVDNAAGNANSLAVYVKVATAAEPAAHTWSFSAVPAGAAGGIQSFSGVDTTSPIDVENGQATPSSTSHPTPSVTTTVANTMVVTHHTFSSSATWTPPAGMSESFERASRAVPNAAGQSIEGNRVEQGPIGATGTKTAVASGNADTGNTHILALKPAPGVATPGGFNAYDTTTAAGAITGFIRTKVAGAATSVDVIALNAARTAILTNFSGAVRVEVLDASDNSGALDPASGCRASWKPIQTVSPDPVFVPADNGRKTVAFTQPNSFRDVRIRVSWPVGAPTVIGCSNDNFALRPASFSIAVTDNTWDSAGTARALANTSATGGNVHKAGRPFTVTVTPSPASATNYDGVPTVSALACTLPAGCIDGTLDLGTFSGSGTRVSNTASYSEAGAFNLTLVDPDYAAVDAADGTPADCSGRYLCQSPAAVAVGRFVPDRFDFVGASTPQFLTFGSASCGSRSFTYIGQRFWYAVLPSATIRALNAGGAVTQNYKGVLFHLSAAGVSETYSNNGVGPALDTTQIGTASLASNGDGTAAYSAAAGGSLAYQRSVTSPIPAVNNPFTANLSLSVTAADNSEAAVAGNGTITSTSALVFDGGGSGIAFDSGAQFRYGRLALRNATGSPLLPLSVPLETHYWNGTAFVTNAADHCTTLAATNIAMSNFTQNLAACETAIIALGAFSSGRTTLRLAAPGKGNAGSVDLTANLGATGSGTTCTSVGGAPVPVSGANLLFLQGNWGGGAFNQNPSARAAFGVYPGAEEVIFIRENF